MKDKPAHIRFDPKQWNKRFTCEVEVGQWGLVHDTFMYVRGFGVVEEVLSDIGCFVYVCPGLLIKDGEYTHLYERELVAIFDTQEECENEYEEALARGRAC